MKLLVLITLGVFVASVLTRSSLPRGIRNDNPGNIKRNSIVWEGMRSVQSDEVFVQFVSPEYGFRAMARILRSYEARGLDTVREIISTYAPSTENDTERYIAFVSEALNVDADIPLDLDRYMVSLIRAISIYENGSIYSNDFTLELIKRGIALA